MNKQMNAISEDQAVLANSSIIVLAYLQNFAEDT